MSAFDEDRHVGWGEVLDIGLVTVLYSALVILDTD